MQSGLRAISLSCALVISAMGQAPPFPMSQPVTGASPLFCCGFRSAADFNHDGRDDLANVQPWGQLMTSLATPSGGYGPATPIYTWPPGNGAALPLCHDVTGDGNVDIVASCQTYASAAQTLLFPGTGTGQFGVPIPIPDTSGFIAPNHTLFAADSLAGPGTSAFLLCSWTYNPVAYKIYLVQVNGQTVQMSAPAVFNAPPTFQTFYFTHSGDINGDGNHDLVGVGNAGTGNTFTHVVYLLGSSAPPYFAPAPVTVPLPPYGAWSGALKDVNKDGIADAVLLVKIVGPGGAFLSDIAVFLGSQSTPFATSIQTPTGLLIGTMVMEDFDGDDIPDIVSGTSGASNGAGMAFCRGDGQGGFRPPMTLPLVPGFYPAYPVSADVDGDGAKDFVSPAGFPTIFYNQSRIGPGGFGASGPLPQMTTGIATPGNPFFHVGIVGGAANSPAILGVSLGLLAAPQSSGLVIDPGSLLLPTPSFGTFTTNAAGTAGWSLSLPSGSPLLAQTVYLQWAIVDAGALSGAGFSMTPGRKIVFW
jgi:hypothetical protein